MGRVARILIVEDSQDDALLLLRELEGGGYAPDWRRVDTREAMRAALAESAWDVVICDYNLPGFSAAEAISLLRERHLDVPIIILSGSIGEEDAVATMRAGASDYIMKGNTARLLPAIERELRESGLRRKAREVEDQLRQAQKMEAVGRLAGGVAHDFNNILTAILGNCELLAQALGDGHPLRRDVEEVMESGLRAAALTRQLLTFSRKQVAQPRALELNTVVANIEKLLRRLIGEDVELSIRPGQGLGLIFADLSQIEQVIMNLAVNARDAMPDGGKLTIETRRVDSAPALPEGGGADAGPRVALTVSDTGCGMSAEVRARLFEPFFTTKEPGKGTGLGLSTVHDIVKQNSGSIVVESAPGRGASFSVYLPLAKGDPGPAVAPAAPPDSLRGSETILLVEDDQALRDLLSRMLANFGYTVLVASGGEAALREAARHADIDMLISDVIMPEMHGGTVAKAVRAMRPDVRVLFLSGYAEGMIAPKGVLDPGVQFLSKPFTTRALAQKVRAVLDARVLSGA